MSTDDPRRWRSLLFVPVTADRFVAKAHTRGADVIILDLEDSVLPDRKAEAREKLPAAARQAGQAGATVCVRINRPLELAVPDHRPAAGATALMLPKVMGPEQGTIKLKHYATRGSASGDFWIALRRPDDLATTGRTPPK